MSQLIEKFGPWALVTGATSGIGQEVAREATRRGFKVLVTGRDPSRLTSLADELPGCEAIGADLARSENMEALIRRAQGLDLGLVVAAAGFGSSGPAVSASLSTELEMIRLNCEAPWRLAHGLGPAMLHRGRGAFVFVSSIVAWQGVAGQANYSATKAYVLSLAEGLAREWGPRGVHVHAAAPGPVESQFARRAGLKMKRADRPDEVARDILDGLGGRTTFVPGRNGRSLTRLLSIAPRSLRVRILSAVTKDMLRE